MLDGIFTVTNGITSSSRRQHSRTVPRLCLGFIRRRRETRQQLCSIDDWTQHLGTSVDAVADRWVPTNGRTNGRRRNWTNCERRVTSYDATCRLRNKWFVLSTPRSTLPQSAVNLKCGVAFTTSTALYLFRHLSRRRFSFFCQRNTSDNVDIVKRLVLWICEASSLQSTFSQTQSSRAPCTLLRTYT